MTRPRDARIYGMPDPGRFSSATEEHQRRAAFAPTAVGERCPVDPDEGTTIESARRLFAPVGRQVENESCERAQYDEDDQRQPEPPTPGA